MNTKTPPHSLYHSILSVLDYLEEQFAVNDYDHLEITFLKKELRTDPASLYFITMKVIRVFRISEMMVLQHEIVDKYTNSEKTYN